MNYRQTFAHAGVILIALLLYFAATHWYGVTSTKNFQREQTAQSMITTTTQAVIISTTTKSFAAVPKASSIPVRRNSRADWFLYADISATSSVSRILMTIARCESGGDPRAKNPTSSARGLLQILDSTWNHFQCDGDPLDPEDNLRCGRKILTTSGIHHWNPSRSCWSQLIESEVASRL